MKGIEEKEQVGRELTDESCAVINLRRRAGEDTLRKESKPSTGKEALKRQKAGNVSILLREANAARNSLPQPLGCTAQTAETLPVALTCQWRYRLRLSTVVI